MNNEQKLIKSKVNEFLLNNRNRYKIFSSFQEHLENLTVETYNDIIEFIASHNDTFFKDHSNAIFFFFNIIRTSQFNFKLLEIYLNIIIHFSDQLKSTGTTENELISICMDFSASINYLFSQNFFKITSIIELSTYYSNLFINFLPEIQNYDSEYASLREKSLFIDKNVSILQDDVAFYELVKSNPEKHILNRTLNYHPSRLHKSIREDDIETFQMILSSNNYSVNHKIEYSRYERSRMIDKELSLIQIAAVYGSLTIFKFLWIQKRIILSKNLLSCAYLGYNYEIIHLCETKCTYRRVYIQPMLFHHIDLLKYYIDNFGNNIHENDEHIKDLLSNYVEEENEEDLDEEEDDDNSLYGNLNSDFLRNAVFSFNFQIIKSCLQKIVFIINNVELNFNSYYKYDSFLKVSKFDIELFTFFYNQVMISHNNEFEQRVNFLFNLMKYNGNDAFKIVLLDEKNVENILFIFRNSIMMNHDVASFILDKIADDEDQEYHAIRDKIVLDDVLRAIQYFNEEIVIKLIKIKNFFNKKENCQVFISHALNFISKKMIQSLFSRFSSILPADVFIQMTEVFQNCDKI